MHGIFSDNVDFLVRILLGAAYGYVIGWEREYRGAPAGDRTFALVALGAAAFTGLGVKYFPASAEKVIAGVATGVGFLGAGLIFRREGGGVLGLTTAAASWAAASMGVLAGAGLFVVGAVSTLIVVFILEFDQIPGLRRIRGGAVRERRLDGPDPGPEG